MDKKFTPRATMLTADERASTFLIGMFGVLTIGYALYLVNSQDSTLANLLLGRLI